MTFTRMPLSFSIRSMMPGPFSAQRMAEVAQATVSTG
jgi:hypothetical protein